MTATRSFLCFLIAAGGVAAGLDGAVPTIRQWKLASLPRTTATADVQRVLTTLDDARATGVRDKATEARALYQCSGREVATPL